MKKSLLLALGLALAGGLGWVAAARAEPLNFAQVPGDAKWLVHVDVDAARASTVVDKAWKKGLELNKDAQGHLDKLREKIGFDICKDLHGLTAYGKEPGKHTGVLIVNAKFDEKLLREKAEKAPDHKVTKFESYDLHSWTEKHHGPARTVWGTLYKPDLLLFASSEDELKGALAVLDGKSPGIDDEARLKGDIKPGTILLMRATGLGKADLHVNCELAKYVEAARFSLGEDGGASFFTAKVVAKDAEVAENLKEVVDGAKALAVFHVGSDAKAKALIAALSVTTKGRALTIKWKAPADDVWKQVEKHAKWLAEWRKRMHPPAKKPAPAGEKPAPGKMEKTPGGSAYHPGPGWGQGFFKNVDLTKEQQAKLADIGKQNGPKFKAAWEKMESIPTAEQKKARDQAFKAAMAAGKKGKEVWDAAEAAMKLTDEQKTKLAEARKQWGDLWKESGEKFRAILTPEQQKKLPPLPPPWGKPAEKPAEKPAPGKMEKMPGGSPNRPAPGPSFFKNLNLTPEQETKLADLRKEFDPKFKAAREKMESVLTDEQKKARGEAMKTARDAGKKGKDVWDAAEAAMKLSDEQKTKLSDARKEMGDLYKEFDKKFRAFLTPEQQDKLRPPRGGKEGAKPAGK